MTAGIDLALAMVEQDLGGDVARAVAGSWSSIPARRWSVAVFGAAGAGAKPAPVQPRVPRRDRPIAGQGGREPARRGRPADDGAKPPSDRCHRSANGFLRIATACAELSCAPSDSRHRRSGETRVRRPPEQRSRSTPMARNSDAGNSCRNGFQVRVWRHLARCRMPASGHGPACQSLPITGPLNGL